MPFEYPLSKRVAIIGGGISGMAAAYHLAPEYNVTLFEAAGRLGGHARTVLAGRNGDVPVDTGFIVFNYQTYPHLTKMFDALNVPVRKSNMSFGVSVEGGRMEYALNDLRAMLAQPKNLLKPQFWRMCNDIVRFNTYAAKTAHSETMTLDELMQSLKLGAWFKKYYLLPMTGAIWSSTPDQMGRFPARSLVQFFKNHALLTSASHDWYTVDGGSVEYVKRLERAIRAQGAIIELGSPVTSVTRDAGGVTLHLPGGRQEVFDQVVLACHSDQALRLLANPTTAERRILGSVRYQDNRAVLHCDTSQMPTSRRAWASWVYRCGGRGSQSRINITYWMNSLQGIDMADPMFVSLNPIDDIAPDKIYDETVFAHPVFDMAALQAQTELRGLQGANNTWYCGAWTKHGFHEDGYASGVAMAERLKYGKLAA